MSLQRRSPPDASWSPGEDPLAEEDAREDDGADRLQRSVYSWHDRRSVGDGPRVERVRDEARDDAGPGDGEPGSGGDVAPRCAEEGADGEGAADGETGEGAVKESREGARHAAEEAGEGHEERGVRGRLEDHDERARGGRVLKVQGPHAQEDQGATHAEGDTHGLQKRRVLLAQEGRQQRGPHRDGWLRMAARVALSASASNGLAGGAARVALSER